MRCFVYKSLRAIDTYVFLGEQDNFQVLPAALQEALGPLAFVLDLELTPGRRLARASGAEVLAAIAERGFHLQLPPPVA